MVIAVPKLLETMGIVAPTTLLSLLLLNRALISVQSYIIMAATSASTVQKTFSKTFFRRELPDTCIAFSSPKGRSLFASALAKGGLRSFFSLMEQHTTQPEPAYCGMSTLVVALNAFAVDPKQTFKGPWRWYTEEMLNCCLDLQQVQQTGITLPDFACLAVCQGLSVDLRYAETPKGSLEEFRKAVHQACMEDDDDDLDKTHNSEQQETNDSNHQRGIRDILIVSYNRKVLGQTGTGHFSPIAAYDPSADAVLILDTARFKYGAHWVPLPLLHSAMIPQDSATGKSRGFVLLSLEREDDDDNAASTQIPGPLANMPVSILFRYKFNDKARSLQAEYYHKCIIQASINNSSGHPTWEDVWNHWTLNGTDGSYVYQILEPQLKHDDAATNALVEQMVRRIQEIMPSIAPLSNDNKPSSCHASTIGEPCRPNRSRTLSLRPQEAIYLVYLASLQSDQELIDLVVAQEDAPTPAEEQLVASVQLLKTVLQLAGDEEPGVAATTTVQKM